MRTSAVLGWASLLCSVGRASNIPRASGSLWAKRPTSSWSSCHHSCPASRSHIPHPEGMRGLRRGLPCLLPHLCKGPGAAAAHPGGCPGNTRPLGQSVQLLNVILIPSLRNPSRLQSCQLTASESITGSEAFKSSQGLWPTSGCADHTGHTDLPWLSLLAWRTHSCMHQWRPQGWLAL